MEPGDKKIEYIVDESSSLGRFRWRMAEPDERFVAAVVQRHSVPDVVARLVCARGIALGDVADYLNPQIKKLLPDPLVMKDMDKAALRIERAVKKGETIGIFGDYDVDGATSSAIMQRFLVDAGVKNVHIHIPDRQDEGYGLSSDGLRELAAKGCTLVVAVDCGITGFDAALMAGQAGLEIVIADHHEAEAGIPEAEAVVDPKRIDDDSGLGILAACGVVFLMCVAVNRRLRKSGHYGRNSIAEPDLFSYLDLVALGTVCDVVPLVGVNRAFVAAGVRVMARRGNMGLKALCDVAGVSTAPTVFHLGYVLGPRINAGGRVGNASIGAQLLTTRSPVIAENLATRLSNFNTERKDIEAAVLARAFEKIEAGRDPDDNFIFIAGENWHTGVIGIIAGRIKERYNLPALVATIDGRGMANGSGRSVPGINIGAAIIKAKETGILVEGGGHSMAAGFTLEAARIGEFKEFLRDYIKGAVADRKIVPVLAVDCAVDIAGITGELAGKLRALEPFGTANEEPRFAVLGAKLTGSDAVGGGNVRCYFSSDNGRSICAIAYKCADTPLGEALLSKVGERFKIAGKIRINEWNGRKSVQFVIDDAAI